MKKIILSLMAILVMASSASAQNNANADSLRKVMSRVPAAMRLAGAKQVVIGADAHKPAVSPRTPSPRTGTASNGNAGGAQQAKKNPTTKIGGKEYFLTPYGPKLPAQVFIDPNTGEELVVDDYGNLIKTGNKQQVPAPNPGNNTGTATAGVTVVAPTPKLDDMYDVLADGRIVAVGNVRVEPAPGTAGGAGAGASTTGTAKLEKMEVGPNDLVINQQTGQIELLDRRRERLRSNRGMGVGTNPEEDHQANTWPNAMAARFSSIDGSGSAGSGGFFTGGGVIVGGNGCFGGVPMTQPGAGCGNGYIVGGGPTGYGNYLCHNQQYYN